MSPNEILSHLANSHRTRRRLMTSCLSLASNVLTGSTMWFSAHICRASTYGVDVCMSFRLVDIDNCLCRYCLLLSSPARKGNINRKATLSGGVKPLTVEEAAINGHTHIYSSVTGVYFSPAIREWRAIKRLLKANYHSPVLPWPEISAGPLSAGRFWANILLTANGSNSPGD